MSRLFSDSEGWEGTTPTLFFCDCCGEEENKDSWLSMKKKLWISKVRILLFDDLVLLPLVILVVVAALRLRDSSPPRRQQGPRQR